MQVTSVSPSGATAEDEAIFTLDLEQLTDVTGGENKNSVSAMQVT